MNSLTILSRPAQMAVAQPLHLSTPAAPKATDDKFSWSEALAIPANTFGAGGGALSAVTGFADRFPAGGVTINPTGIVRNPEWTRSFGEGTMPHALQPILSGVAAGVCGVRGAAELMEGSRAGNKTQQLAGCIDLALGVSSAAQIVSPGLAGAASLALFAARTGIDLVAQA